MPLWILLGLLLIGPPRNRRRQAWWIVLPPLAVACLGGLLGLAVEPSDSLDILFYFLTVLSIAWASVWLLAPWLRAGNRLVRAIWMWIAMAVIGVAGYLSYYQFAWSGDAGQMWAMMWSVASVTLVAATTIAGRCWRGRCPMYVFMFWLVLWMPVVCLVGMIVFAIIAAVTLRSVEVLGGFLCSSLPISLMISACLYVLNAPAMALARFCPFYRERFALLFGPFEPEDANWPSHIAEPITAELAGPGDEPAGDCPFDQANSP